MRFRFLGVAAGIGLIGLAASAPAQDAALPDGPGKAQLTNACSTCHSLTEVTSQVRTAPQWSETVDQMIARGASVSDEDYPVIVAYLAKNFSPNSAPVGGAAPPASTASPASTAVSPGATPPAGTH